MVQSSIELKKAVNLHTISGYEYKQFLDIVWNRNWNKNKKECQNKIEWLENKQKKELKIIVQMKQIVNRDEGLEIKVQYVHKTNKEELEKIVQNVNNEKENKELEMIAPENRKLKRKIMNLK